MSDKANAGNPGDSLQLAALGWMHKHQHQFEGNDGKMCVAVTRHLMDNMDASRIAAENAVVMAYGDLRHTTSSRYADLSLSTGAVVVLRDKESDMAYVIPVEKIYQRMIAPFKPNARTQLTVVKSDLH